MQLRIAGADTPTLEDLLAHDLPVDGLQHAGRALLRADRSDRLIAVAGLMIVSLRDRDWDGDRELIAELEHYADGGASGLILLPVDLDELGEALDESRASESYIDLVSGTLWPAQLFEVDQGPDDFDPDDSRRWLLVDGLGPGTAYGVMQRFISTIDQSGLASRLGDAIAGSRAFRRFESELSRHPDEYTRWHRFRDDARLGRARAWLAGHGYRPTP